MPSSNYIKGITVKIEGDTGELSKSLSEVNGDIKNTSRALKDVEKALQLDPGNVELLAQQQELLNKQIEQTREKLELEQQAAEQAAEALANGTISQEEYASLSAEVATTASELENLEGAADGAGGSIEDTGAAAADAGTEAENSGASFEGWGDAVAGAAEVAAGALAAVSGAVAGIGAAVVEGTGALVNAATDTSDFGDTISKTAQKIGMSTEAFQKWDYVMQLSGTSMEQSQAGFKTLTNSLDAAREGSKGAIEKFQAIGLSMDDLAGLSREDVFGKVIEGLQGMTDDAEKAAAANDLLGKAGMNLMPLLNQTAESTKKLMDETEQYGFIMDESAIDASVKYKDSLTRMDATIQGVKNDLVGQFLPGITQVMDGISGMAAGMDGADEDIAAGVDDIVSTFEGLIPTIQSTIETLLPVLLPLGLEILSTIGEGIIANLPIILGFATDIIMSLLTALTTPENLSQLLGAAVDIILTLLNGLLDALEYLIEPAMAAIETLVNALLDPAMLEKIINSAIKIIMTIVGGLTKALPKLIPAIVSAINTITVELTNHTDELILAALDIIVALADGLIKALPTIVTTIVTRVIPSLLEAFGRLGKELPGKAITWGKDLIKSMIDGIKSMLGSLGTAVGNVAKTIASFLHFSVPDVGPLADFDKSGGDMIDEFITSMDKEQPELKKALYQTSSIINGGMTGGPNYTGALEGISSQLAGMAGHGGGNYVINVQVGRSTLATAVISAQQMENYRTGGT